MNADMKPEKRAEIFLVAQRLFGRFGLRKTTVEEIIRLARVAKGTFYKYFSDKDVLFLEIVEKESASLVSAIREAVAQVSTSQEKMAAYLRTKVGKVAELINFYKVTSEKIDEYWPKIEGVREKYLIEERKIVREILTGGIDKGELEVADLELTTHAIVMAMGGLESSWMMRTSPLKLEESVDSLLNVLLKGILKN
jgi:AcrR family transcriptional regulator